MKVHDIMTEDVACCTTDTSLQDVARVFEECDCGAIPVVESEDNHRVIGMVTDRDIVIRCIAKGRNPLEATAGDCMTPDVETISRNADLDECIQLMERLQVRRVPVVDEQRNCVGIIAQADIARKAPEHEVADVLREISEPAQMHAAHVG